MDHSQVINERDVESTEPAAEERPGFRRRQLAAAAGSEQLGCSLYTLEPEARSWPYHYHTANEEAIFVLAGRGTVRLGDDEVTVESGDFVALPADEAGGHEVINTGEEELRYLCVSTMTEPDVTVYPDANMIGVFAGAPPGGDSNRRTFHRYLEADAEVDYWTGGPRRSD